MELFDTFPFTRLQGKNRGLDWVIQKVGEFKKVVDGIPETVRDEVNKAVGGGVDFKVVTDKTLTLEDSPADAKAVGDKIAGLTAADVGARPADWTPTAAEVGARPAGWTPTAEQVGARPNTWFPTAAEVGALPIASYVIGPGSSVKLQTASCFVAIGRLSTTNGTTGYYAVTAYSSHRAPHIQQMSVGANLSVVAGGDNDNGWYTEFSNTATAGNIVLTAMGGCSRV